MCPKTLADLSNGTIYGGNLTLYTYRYACMLQRGMIICFVQLAGKEAAHCRGDSDPEGTSSKKNHIPIRGQCLQHFESAFGYLPLLCFHGQRLKMP